MVRRSSLATAVRVLDHLERFRYRPGQQGRTISARPTVIATGLTDYCRKFPGLRERSGRDVLHCPTATDTRSATSNWCIRERTPFPPHQALLVRQLSPDVVFFRHTSAEISAGGECETGCARN